MVNKQVIRQWVADLRSGEYQQGRGGLCVIQGDDRWFCCLGVLMEQAVKAGVQRPRVDYLSGSYPVDDYPSGERSSLTEVVASWSGLGVSDPKVDFGDNEHINLSFANDSLGLTFSQIADAIEAQFLKEDGSDVRDPS